MFLGFGTGAVLVASYSCALNAARQLPGFPDDVSTYSLVSSFWTAAYAIGSFFGTSLAGLLFDNVGWEWSCTAVQGLIFVALLPSLGILCRDKRSKYKELEGVNMMAKKP